MAQEQRHKDRKVELATQDSVIIAVANRNLQIAKGADPDPNVGTGFYPEPAVESPIPEGKPSAPKRRRRRTRRAS